MNPYRLSCHALLVISCFSAAGCGSREYAPVAGVVTFKGEPVDKATVIFSLVDGDKFATGETGPDGRYELVTQGSKKQIGAKIGRHRVSINALELDLDSSSGPDESLGSLAMIGGKEPKIKSRLPQKYANFDSSQLEYEVESGSNQADFELTD